MDLLNTYTHHSELQIITALSFVSILYKSLAQAKSSQFSFDVSWKRFLTAEILQLPALRSSSYGCPYRIQPNSLNYNTITSQTPLQSSTEIATLN
jgi:hypothetical protein